MPAPKSDGPTAVYVIACGDCVKVGISSDPERRLNDMRTGMSETPRLVATRVFPNRLHARRAEGLVHWRLGRYRARYRSEWFRVEPKIAIRALLHAKLPEIVV